MKRYALLMFGDLYLFCEQLVHAFARAAFVAVVYFHLSSRSIGLEMMYTGVVAEQRSRGGRTPLSRSVKASFARTGPFAAASTMALVSASRV